MKKFKKIAFAGFIAVLSIQASAQNTWSLQQTVDYALENNISIKQSDIQARMAGVNLKQIKESRFPSLSAGANYGYSAGRNQDPTTFNLITQGFWTSSYSLQSSVNLFNWFALNNNIDASKFEAAAAQKSVEKLKNDVSLNVAAAYLQALVNKEQVHASKVQIQLTTAQLENTRKLVAAGAVPELNAAELEAQLARDSSTLVSAEMMEIQSVLQLKALLNMDAAIPFDIDNPDVANIPVESLLSLQPEYVYSLAREAMPLQKVNEFRVAAAKSTLKAARAQMLPSVSMFGSLGSSTNNQAFEVIGVNSIPNVNPIGRVSVGGTEYNVVPFNPTTNVPITRKQGYFDQVNQNFRQSVGLSLSIPIFSGGQLRANRSRQQLNLENTLLQQKADDLDLKQTIYRAYAEAYSALQKYQASEKSVQAAQKVYDFASKRYENGMLQTLELITNQTNLFRATIDKLTAQYDYVFKMKVLEFYKGSGIKL
jgi:outer membrane protein